MKGKSSNVSKVSSRMDQQTLPDNWVIKVRWGDDNQKASGVESVKQPNEKEKVKDKDIVKEKLATACICGSHEYCYLQLPFDPNVWCAISFQWVVGQKTFEQDASIFDQEIRAE